MTHPSDDELEAMAAWLEASAYVRSPAHEIEAAVMLRACKRCKPLTFEDCVRIVETTEPPDMTEDGDKRWTRRMAEALFNHIEALEARAEKAEAERDALRDREKHFASVLSVADGGQYRNDWDAAIRRVVAERDALRAAINRAGALACQRASHAFIIDALKEDKNA